jgi:putative intracellular protease/amidase
LEELAAPYLEFVKAGASVEIASPRGGLPPVDPKSSNDPSPAARAFQDDSSARAKLEGTLRLAEVTGSFDAYFVVGGHGTMWDLCEDVTLAGLLAGAFENGKVVAAVCHGPAALVNVRLSDGTLLIKDRKVTGFSDAEEQAVGLSKVVPFALESALRERGGKYECGPLWQAFAVRDENLVTGQNPASSALTARQVLEALG